MGKPILQIPKTHPTEVLNVKFSSLEREEYAQLEEPLRERATEMDGNGEASRVVSMRDLNRLRVYISHPALVNPDYPGGGAAEIQEWGLVETAATTRQYFCRLCLHVLAGPMVPQVSIQTQRLHG